MKNKRLWIVTIFILLGFVVSLYWVGYSPWGSEEVAKYNGGYGTFDMKEYDKISVQQVLGKMEPEGYDTYYGYFLGDTFFVFFYGGLQFLITVWLYKRVREKNRLGSFLFLLTVFFLVLRGIADTIENGFLFYTLHEYPVIHTTVIWVASMATKIKLSCIFFWNGMIFLGIFLQIMVRCKEPVLRIMGRNCSKWKRPEETQRKKSSKNL